MNTERVQQFLEEFTAWAASRPDILAVALVGSHARSQARPDSDVDLVLVCARPVDYLADVSWALRFGELSKHQVEDYGKVTSLRAWYGDGLEVEYGITDEDWAALPLDAGTRRVMSDGMIVLVDKSNLLSRHQSTNRAPNGITGLS